MPAGGFVGVQHFQVAPDDDARAAQFAQHIGHHFVVAGELVVQPDVAEREANLFEQMENQFQLGVDQRLAGDAPVENRHAHDAAAAGHRHGHLRAEQFKFLLRLDIRAGFMAVAAENSAQPDKLAADAGVEREFKIFKQARRKADGGGGAQAAAVLRRSRIGERRERAVQENGGAIDAEDFAEEQKELLQHRLGIQRMGEDGRKIAQHVEGLRRAGEAAGRRRLHLAQELGRVGCRGRAGGAAGWSGGVHSRSSNAFSSRLRTGLVRTWVTPCRKASSSHSDWFSAV